MDNGTGIRGHNNSDLHQRSQSQMLSQKSMDRPDLERSNSRELRRQYSLTEMQQQRQNNTSSNQIGRVQKKLPNIPNRVAPYQVNNNGGGQVRSRGRSEEGGGGEYGRYGGGGGGGFHHDQGGIPPMDMERNASYSGRMMRSTDQLYDRDYYQRSSSGQYNRRQMNMAGGNFSPDHGRNFQHSISQENIPPQIPPRPIRASHQFSTNPQFSHHNQSPATGGGTHTTGSQRQLPRIAQDQTHPSHVITSSSSSSSRTQQQHQQQQQQYNNRSNTNNNRRGRLQQGGFINTSLSSDAASEPNMIKHQQIIESSRSLPPDDFHNSVYSPYTDTGDYSHRYQGSNTTNSRYHDNQHQYYHSNSYHGNTQHSTNRHGNYHGNQSATSSRYQHATQNHRNKMQLNHNQQQQQQHQQTQYNKRRNGRRKRIGGNSFSSSDDENVDYDDGLEEGSCVDMEDGGGGMYGEEEEEGMTTSNCCTSCTEDGDYDSYSERGYKDDYQSNTRQLSQISLRKKTDPIKSHLANSYKQPVNWKMSKDNRRLIGHMILQKAPMDPNSSPYDSNTAGGILGLKVIGGKMTSTGRLAAFITKVKAGSIADVVGGLKAGDEVLEWNGRSFKNLTYEEVNDIILDSRFDTDVELTVQRELVEPQRNQSDDNQRIPKTLDDESSKIQLKMHYSNSTQQFQISLLQAINLIPCPSKPVNFPCSAFVKFNLLPEKNEQNYRRSRLVSNSNDPVWNQTFTFAPLKILENRVCELEVNIFDYDRESESAELIGEVIIDLRRANLNDLPCWYPIYLVDFVAAPPNLDGSRSSIPGGGTVSDSDIGGLGFGDRSGDERVESARSIDREYKSNPNDPESRMYWDTTPVNTSTVPHKQGEGIGDTYDGPIHHQYQPNDSRNARQSTGIGPKSSRKGSSRYYSPPIDEPMSRANKKSTQMNRGGDDMYPANRIGGPDDSLNIKPASSTATGVMHGKKSINHPSPYPDLRFDKRFQLVEDEQQRDEYEDGTRRRHASQGFSQNNTGSLDMYSEEGPQRINDYGDNLIRKREGEEGEMSDPSIRSSPTQMSRQPRTSIQPRDNEMTQNLPRENPEDEDATPVGSIAGGVSEPRSIIKFGLGDENIEDQTADIESVGVSGESGGGTSSAGGGRRRVRLSDGGEDGNSNQQNPGTGTSSASTSEAAAAAAGRRKRRPSIGQKFSTVLGFSRKSSSTSNLDKKPRSSFQRCEEVLPANFKSSAELDGPKVSELIPHPPEYIPKQKDRISRKDGSNVSQSAKMSTANESHVESFVEGLGPGQLVGRQVLGMPCLGEIQLSFIDRKGHLEVEVIRARNLVPKNNSKVLPQPYVKLHLLDGKISVEKQRTTVSQRRTLDPLYQQQIFFNNHYKHKILQVSVWGEHGRMEKKSFMGMCDILLDDLDLSSIVFGWYKLFGITASNVHHHASKSSTDNSSGVG